MRGSGWVEFGVCLYLGGRREGLKGTCMDILDTAVQVNKCGLNVEDVAAVRIFGTCINTK